MPAGPPANLTRTPVSAQAALFVVRPPVSAKQAMTIRQYAAQSKPVERRRRRVTGLTRNVRYARRAASETEK